MGYTRKELPRDDNGRIIFKGHKTRPTKLDNNVDYFKSEIPSIYKEISNEILDVDVSIISKIIKCYQDKVAERIKAGFSVEMGSLGIAWVYHKPGGRKSRAWGFEGVSYPKRVLRFNYRAKIETHMDKINADLKCEAKGITPEQRLERRQRFIESRMQFIKDKKERILNEKKQ